MRHLVRLRVLGERVVDGVHAQDLGLIPGGGREGQHVGFHSHVAREERNANVVDAERLVVRALVERGSQRQADVVERVVHLDHDGNDELVPVAVLGAAAGQSFVGVEGALPDQHAVDVQRRVLPVVPGVDFDKVEGEPRLGVRDLVEVVGLAQSGASPKYAAATDDRAEVAARGGRDGRAAVMPPVPCLVLAVVEVIVRPIGRYDGAQHHIVGGRAA